MTTQVIFKIDKKLKDQAMKKAQNEGLPFAAVLKLATKAFVEGTFDVGLVPHESFSVSTRNVVRRALKDVRRGKNISPHFISAREAVTFLKN